MTSNPGREANARNAQLSTGSRTKAGKARSKRNALKHGLAIPIAAHPHLSSEAHKLAEEFVVHGVTGDPVSLAEACLDLRRIREIRADVVATILVPAQSTRGRDELTSTVATSRNWIDMRSAPEPVATELARCYQRSDASVS